ncbi:MAG: hypothetical protein U0T58_00350 [Buchnera aphidicola (Meitanaphis elongallis)]
MSKIIDVVTTTLLHKYKHSSYKSNLKKQSVCFFKIFNNNFVYDKSNVKRGVIKDKKNEINTVLNVIFLKNKIKKKVNSFEERNYLISDIVSKFYLFLGSNTYTSRCINNLSQLNGLSFQSQIHDFSLRYAHHLFEKIKRVNRDVVFNLFRKNIDFVSSIVNFKTFKGNAFQTVPCLKSITMSNIYFKKKTCYNKGIDFILDYEQTIYLSNLFINVNYENYVKKIYYCIFYSQDMNLIKNYWIESVHKQLLSSFFKKKTIVELFLYSQCLGSLFIRFKTKKNKLIKLDLISNNSTVRKLLKSDISSLHNVVFKTGIKFEDITVRDQNFRETIILKNNCHYYD